MKKTLLFAGLMTVIGIQACWAMASRTQSANADTNAATTTTSMNGNTSAAGGVAISSTAASSESRDTSGSSTH